MADHSELKKLAESLNRAIEQAEHKPGQWVGAAQSMGGICCAGEPFQIGKPWAKEDPWAHFSYKRDSWLAVAAVNALPQFMALIVEVEENDKHLRAFGGVMKSQDEQIQQLKTENEALKGLYRMHQQAETREMRDIKAEIAGLKTGYEAFEQVNAGLKAEVEVLRKDAERYRWLRDQCGVVEYKAITGSIGSGMLPSGEYLDAALSAAMGQGERS